MSVIAAGYKDVPIEAAKEGAEMNSKDPKLKDEPARLAALHRYEVLDTSREESFDRITALVQTVLKVPICTVAFIDADRQWFKSWIGVVNRETARAGSFCTHTIMEREPLHIPNALLDIRFAGSPMVLDEPFIRSYVGVPLPTPDGYNVGSLCAIDLVPRKYSADQIELLKSFAAVVVDELELRRIAQTDHLTGTANRRSFTLELDRTISSFEKLGSPAALLFLDLDHFKRINDTFGHAAGDLVLKTVSAELARHLRKGDIIGRLGGEEFGILLRDTSFEDAATTAERLRSYIESLAFGPNSPLKATASIGIAHLGCVSTTVKQWMASADNALYEAKRQGRNRCCVAAPIDADGSQHRPFLRRSA